MSKLSSLVGKPKTFKIGEIELELSPRRLEEIDILIDMQDESKRGAAMKQLIQRTLKEAVPDATDEEINKVAFNHFKELSQAIMEVNGLDQPKTD